MRPLNCCECGRFIGPDGDPDIGFDPYMGGYDIGYPRCGPCLRKINEEMEPNHEKESHDSQ